MFGLQGTVRPGACLPDRPFASAWGASGVKAARHAPALEPRASRVADEHGEAPPLTPSCAPWQRFSLQAVSFCVSSGS
ncbi:hypothetical protein, partial [Kozakia baliensis]|uniref:hypothetical protein n=1 Tax=Kozakia baliensis TaxID=153496 RepID=UPI00222F2BF5